MNALCCLPARLLKLMNLACRRIAEAHNQQRREKAEDPAAFESDVHVFNSFFYKNISAKKKDTYVLIAGCLTICKISADQLRPGFSGPGSDAYQSVRRWTSKFDLFKKKFVVIPINEQYVRRQKRCIHEVEELIWSLITAACTGTSPSSSTQARSSTRPNPSPNRKRTSPSRLSQATRLGRRRCRLLKERHRG